MRSPAVAGRASSALSSVRAGGPGDGAARFYSFASFSRGNQCAWTRASGEPRHWSSATSPVPIPLDCPGRVAVKTGIRYRVPMWSLNSVPKRWRRVGLFLLVVIILALLPLLAFYL